MFLSEVSLCYAFPNFSITLWMNKETVYKFIWDIPVLILDKNKGDKIHVI